MSDSLESFRRRHLRFGWYSLALFLSLGALLEILHGFKVGFYLDVDNEVRRLMWRLCHAHGTLLALVNIAAALSVDSLKLERPSALKLASACLIVGSLLLPLGFFLGGMLLYGGDPSVFVLLVPVGAVLLFVGIVSVARRVQ